MLYITIGFIFGFSIPYLARRFSKFMPATLAYALYRIFSPNKRVSKSKRLNCHKYILLRNRYFMRSLGWGIISAAIIFLGSLTLPSEETPWITFFILILLLLTEIDKRILYLPDILTSPLLISGFLYATFAGQLLGSDTQIATANSALGAAFGYIIPVIASLLLIKKHPDNMGGGDIKTLAAIGAWLGLSNIAYVILLACPIFAISCFINKQHQGAFGPSIVLAALIILFILEY
ncbi:MAG: prepilin peptidase [Alphaproteobacteria bacterium]|nr:prepilin peptidase [Alphaproteobacteria bacterium]